MLVLYICYLTFFLLLIIVTLKEGIKKGLLLFPLVVFSYGIIYYQLIGRIFETQFAFSLLLLLMVVLTIGVLIDNPWEKKVIEIFSQILQLMEDEERELGEILENIIEKIPLLLYRRKVWAQLTYGDCLYTTSRTAAPTTSYYKAPIGGGELEVLGGEAQQLLRGEKDNLDSLSIMIGLFLKERRAERSLLEEQRRHSFLLDTLDIQIWTMDNPTTYGYINRAHREFLDLPKEEVEHTLIKGEIPKEIKDLILKDNEEVFSTGKTIMIVEWVKDRKGEGHLLSIVKTPVFKEKDQVVSMICYAHDLTEKRGVEDRLEEYSIFLASIFDAAPIGMITHNKKGFVTSWNKGAQKIFGYSKEEIIGKEFHLHPQDKKGEFHSFLQHVLKGQRIKDYQLKRCGKDGSLVHFSFSAFPLFNRGGKVIGAISFIMDITGEKRAKEKLFYQNQHDPMTGLYNRFFMEKEIKRLHYEGIIPTSVIIGDVNGLRLINDALGRDEGNRILQSIAKILEDSCREGDLIGRWGDDEFIVLLPGLSYQETLKICSRICSVDMESIASLPVSLAFNCSTKNTLNQDLQELVRSTEDLLYKDQQELIQHGRDTILSSMMKMLSSVSDETEEHNWRMQIMAMEMGELLHLSEMELEQLSLLVSLHDIGKITIDKDILSKEDIFSLNEWEEVKGHSEAGYFIAHSSEAFAHVADAILTHHERWDGTGYPKQLKGGEIPIISRILSIVDTYDTITQKRSYGYLLPKEKALMEMKKESEKQFDPHLLDVFIGMMKGNNLMTSKGDNTVKTRPISAQYQLTSSYKQIQALSRRLLHAQEEEMARLARDLHDDIGQNMTALKLDLELLATEISNADVHLIKRMETTILLVDTLIDSIRHQASSLRPPVLDDIGLLAAIQSIVYRYRETTKMKILLDHEGMEERFPRDVETVLYRCVQESLTNIIRHSRASKVQLDLKHRSQEITTLIRDNGCGFDLENLEISSEHIGLTGMKERVQLVNGSFFIQSKVGEGTEIFISVPLP